MNILAPTEDLSSLIWCEVVDEATLRIRCNRCSVHFWQGSYFDHVNPGNDWLGTAITHIATFHSDELRT